MKKYVLLVDKNDIPYGEMEKMEAHRKGLLHRAFSIFIFNRYGELLLQKRSLKKYHSPGLWTNTCCSHPQFAEDIPASARKRLYEEMGFSCGLEHLFHFIYKAEMGNGLVEHELDHVFIGFFNGKPKVNAQEVAAWKYSSMDEIRMELAEYPHHFTPWFRIIFDRVELELREIIGARFLKPQSTQRKNHKEHEEVCKFNTLRTLCNL